MVAVVSPVTDPPAMVWYKDGRMGDIPDQVIDLFVAAEALVTTARTKYGVCTGLHNSASCTASC